MVRLSVALSRDCREALAHAWAGGDDEVTVLLAVDPDRQRAVADEVERLRGSLVRELEEIGYLRARVPTENVEELAAHGAVETASVMFTAGIAPVKLEEGQSSADVPVQPGHRAPDAGLPTGPNGQPLVPGRSSRAPLLADPFDPAYSPLPDLAADTFLAENPTYDGRGVTVALIDGFIDQLLPEFQTATTLDGGTVRKVLDVISPLDPEIDGGPEWITAWEPVTATGGTFSVGEDSYVAPRDGEFLLGFLDESKMYFRQRDLTCDGNPEGSSPLNAVLWDRSANVVWVDTDQDHSFADSARLADFRESGDIGVFGAADPAAPVRESIMFTVQIRADRDAVAVHTGTGAHATAVAGATFGSRGEKGRYDGIAPGAQIVSVTPNPGDARTSAGTYIEALYTAMSDPRVDLVVWEPHTGVAGRYLPTDGRSITSVIARRLVERYGKALFVAAGNLAHLNQIGDESAGDAVFGIGGYQSGDCYRINDGILLPERNNLHWASSHGPAGDGGLAPMVLAPSNLLSSWVGHAPEQMGVHRFPAGYNKAGGTSTATPSAAAAATLLISAAKQAGIGWDVPRLRHALCATARFLPGIPAHAQGHGLIQVEAAWEALRAMHDDDAAPARLETSAPVRTASSARLREPHRGRGLYEREGWSVGDRGTRNVTVTRRGGPAEPVQYAVSVVGDDCTFTATADTVALGCDEPAEIEIAIAPDTPGVHSALLLLSHPSVWWDRHAVLVTIVVPGPHELASDGSFDTTVQTRTAWPGAVFFQVPDGAGNVLQVQAVGKQLFIVSPPDGSPGYAKTWSRGDLQLSTSSPAPSRGVWEAALIDGSARDNGERHRLLEAKPQTVRLRVSALQADVVPALGPGVRLAPDRSGALRLHVTNRRAAFTGSVASRPLAAARTMTASIKEHELQVYELEVEPASDALLARVATTDGALGSGDGGVDLDVYLFDCTGDFPVLIAKNAGVSATGTVFTESPKPGTWKVVVDAVASPGGSVGYDYLDLVTNPRYGWLTTADTAREHPSGQSWSVPAHLWFVEQPSTEGRCPAALALVTSDEVRTVLPQPPWNPETDGDEYFTAPPTTMRVPLGWAAVLFEDTGQRVVTG